VKKKDGCKTQKAGMLFGETGVHVDILNQRQKNVLKQLGYALTGADFYLAGGTALALHIGHRLSIDLDWFITTFENQEKLFQKLRESGIVFDIKFVDAGTVYLEIDTVQVSFIGYNYPMLHPPISMTVPYDGVKLAATDDIACMKLSAIASRGSRKDFIDLYFLINLFRSLEGYLKLYMQKYQNRDIGHVIRSLVYFQDAEAEPETIMLKPFDWQDMKAKWVKWVKCLNVL